MQYFLGTSPPLYTQNLPSRFFGSFLELLARYLIGEADLELKDLDALQRKIDETD